MTNRHFLLVFIMCVLILGTGVILADLLRDDRGQCEYPVVCRKNINSWMGYVGMGSLDEPADGVRVDFEKALLESDLDDGRTVLGFTDENPVAGRTRSLEIESYTHACDKPVGMKYSETTENGRKFEIEFSFSDSMSCSFSSMVHRSKGDRGATEIVLDARICRDSPSISEKSEEMACRYLVLKEEARKQTGNSVTGAR